MSIPHKPYVFDENGDSIDEYYQDFRQKELYLQQLKFANEMTINTIDKILSNSERTSIIIIQSDHGERTDVDWTEPSDQLNFSSKINCDPSHLPFKFAENCLVTFPLLFCRIP